MAEILASTSGHLLQHFMKLMMSHATSVLVQTLMQQELHRHLLLWAMTTSVTQAVRIAISISSKGRTLSGMAGGVVLPTPAVP